jgi:hypothetical protein
LARIIVLGGYGVFGGKLARRLIAETSADILVAGRSLDKAQAFCRSFGGTPVAIDRDAGLPSALAEHRPDIVVDAAGPFQAYGDDPYKVARATIAIGAHYVDLADDADFVAGIGALDAQARTARVAVISGASTVPAISSAAADALTAGLTHIALIDTAILPGNRAPRGLSVVRAIVGQVGRPLTAWRGGTWTTPVAWADTKRVTLAVDGVLPVERRRASRIGAPDLLLFPKRYGARSVEFRAGLELGLLHEGLRTLGWLVRFGVLRSLLPLTRPMKWTADRLEGFGSDRGGMLVRVVGRNADGEGIERTWTVIAEAGDGPEIPPTPALLICRTLVAHIDAADDTRSLPMPGAFPAVGLLTLAEIEAGLAPFAIRFERRERPAVPLLERALEPEATAMPAAWRRLADVHDIERFAGMASVERGTGLVSRMVGAVFGFPPAADHTPVEVTKEVMPAGEDWTRRFGRKEFVSHLSRRRGDGPGILRERFGPFSFIMRLAVREGRVHWPVESWRFLGIPMPKVLMPQSETFEFVDAAGHFNFDVGIAAALAGRVVRYRGWLRPIDDAGDGATSQTDHFTGSSSVEASSRQPPVTQSRQADAVAPDEASTSSMRGGTSGR